MQKEAFNQLMRSRTKVMALAVIQLYSEAPKSDEFRIVGKQLVRSATSVAANYRAACRARPAKEFFAKISIVVEEADKTLFWLELLEESKMITPQKPKHIQQESLEILKIASVTRKNTKV